MSPTPLLLKKWLHLVVILCLMSLVELYYRYPPYLLYINNNQLALDQQLLFQTATSSALAGEGSSRGGAFMTSSSPSPPLQQQKLQPNLQKKNNNKYVERYTQPKHLPNLINRGMNFLTVLSGCRIASFVYVGDPKRQKHSNPIYEDCTLMMNVNVNKNIATATTTTTANKESLNQQPISILKRIKSIQQLELLQPNDTIYVTFTKLESFVNDILPYLTTNVVLITGQWQLSLDTTPLPTKTVETILGHSNIIHWFCQNLDVYLGNDKNPRLYNNRHSKISPFPYGLREGQNDITTNTIYKQAVLQSLHLDDDNNNDASDGGGGGTGTTDDDGTETNTNKTTTKHSLIYVGYLAPTTNQRKHIPSSTIKVSKEQYYNDISHSQYIISPNGDRPECYRHYEAIGLNTIPITQLHPIMHRHLNNSVIYDTERPNNGTWNIQELEHYLLTTTKSKRTVNRNMVFEEYWMEYVERIVATTNNSADGRPLRWWDRNTNQRTTLANLAMKEEGGVMNTHRNIQRRENKFWIRGFWTNKERKRERINDETD